MHLYFQLTCGHWAHILHFQDNSWSLSDSSFTSGAEIQHAHTWRHAWKHTRAHTHINDDWREGVLRPWIKERQKEQQSLFPYMSRYVDALHSIGSQSYKKCLLSEGRLFTQNSLFSASNTDSEPTTVNIRRLRHSLSLLHTSLFTRVYIYTVPFLVSYSAPAVLERWIRGRVELY